MKIKPLHPWKVTIAEAKTIQLELAEKVVLEKLKAPVRVIAGADVSYARKGAICFAAVTVFNYPEMQVIEQVTSSDAVSFPYVPGYLTFREAPALLQAFEKLSHEPDLVLFDGQGIAHPRRMGLATHSGMILDKPAIGCAKSLLVGKFENPLSSKGDWSDLIYGGLLIGAAVRTRDRVKPVFVSPGFKITLHEAIEWVVKTCIGYRIPEPIRKSHFAVNQLRVEYEKENSRK